MCLMVTLTARSPPSVLSTWTQSSKGSNLTITVFPLKPGTNIFRPCNLSFASPDILGRVIKLLYLSLPLSLLIKHNFLQKIVYLQVLQNIISSTSYNIIFVGKRGSAGLCWGFESGGWIWRLVELVGAYQKPWQDWINIPVHAKKLLPFYSLSFQTDK